MFYFYVEIFSWKQLIKLEPDLMEQLQRDIEDLVYQSGGAVYDEIPWVYMFSSSYKETLWRLLDNLFSMVDILKNNSENLHGYSIVVTQQTENQQLNKKELDELCYLITEDKQIWLDPKCNYLAEEHLNLEHHSKIFKVLSLKSRGPLLCEGKKILCKNMEMENHLNEMINQNNPKNILFFTNSVIQDLKTAFSIWLEDQKIEPMVLSINQEAWQLTYYPFFQSLKKDVLDNNKSWTDQSYKTLLESLENENYSFLARDYFNVDFKAAYFEYLQCWVKMASEKKKPAIILVEEPLKLKEEARSFIRNLMDKWKPQNGCSWVFLSSEKPGLEFEDLSSISMVEESSEKIIEIMENAFPQFSKKNVKKNIIQENGPRGMLQKFLAAVYMDRAGQWESLEHTIGEIYNSLDSNAQNLVLLMYDYNGPMDMKLLQSCKVNFPLEPNRLKDMVERLCELALIENIGNNYYRALWGNIPSLISNNTNSQTIRRRVIEEYATVMLEQWKAKGLADPWQYLSIREFMDEESALMSLNMLIQWLVENQLFLPLRDFLANISVQSESMQNVVNSGRLSMALLMNKRQKIQEMIDLGQINLGAAGGQYIEESRLQLARYYQFTGDPDQALNFSKEALFGFQKTGNHRGEVFANLELALALLAQQKMGTALDYFEISRRIGNQLNQSYGLILASSLETMGIFLFGNLSLAERNVQQQLELSQREGRRDREFFLGFLQGRILFELGEYKEASQCFSQLYHRTKKFDYLDCGAASIRWQARSLIYHGKIEQGKKILNGLDQTPEGLFFLAEGDFFSKSEHSALKKLKEARQIEQSRVYNWSQKTDWSDGFQAIEGWLYSASREDNVLRDQMETMYLYLNVKTGLATEAMQGLNRLLQRGDHPFRPYSHKYFYLCSKALQGRKQESTEEDYMVLLSKAIEKLQSRAGRFDDQKKKNSYLQKNYWNRCIIDEAQKKKFI